MESYKTNPLAEVFIRQKEKLEPVSVNLDDSVIDADSLYHKFNLNGDESQREKTTLFGNNVVTQEMINKIEVWTFEKRAFFK